MYVVIGGWDYEGYAPPIGVFDSIDAANNAIKTGKYKSYDFVKIYRYELNVADSGSEV